MPTPPVSTKEFQLGDIIRKGRLEFEVIEISPFTERGQFLALAVTANSAPVSKTNYQWCAAYEYELVTPAAQRKAAPRRKGTSDFGDPPPEYN